MPALPDWLPAGVLRAGEHVVIVAQCAYKLNAVGIDQPMLIMPLVGMKRIELGMTQANIEPGDFLMVHQVTSLPMENIPPASGDLPYRAWTIGFPWRIVELARALLNSHMPPVSETSRALPFSSGPVAPLLPALRQLLEVLAAPAEPDAALIDHAQLGVLIALARNGHGQFLNVSDASLSARIRLLVAAAPDREWISADFEDTLHISGATLRRRLAEENTSLRALLLEARLHHGLMLLQTTRRPLKSIAQACCYRSVPSFTRNFIARFGIEPAAVAGR
ncbi:MAG TPA: helix-turn-helix domain-containing protein [Paucimonas sp.]|nr:helix-turn-helix domain-containing protein [Paucimonas sp.]